MLLEFWERLEKPCSLPIPLKTEVFGVGNVAEGLRVNECVFDNVATFTDGKIEPKSEFSSFEGDRRRSDVDGIAYFKFWAADE